MVRKNIDAWLCLAVLCCVCVLALPVFCADEDEEQGVKKYGMTYNIAQDREVIKVGGIYEPEGLDKYLKRRLDKVDAQLAELDGKLAKIDEDLQKFSAALKQHDAKTMRSR